MSNIAVNENSLHSENAVAVIDQTTAIVSVIERAMTNPEVDIDKMERIMALQERILDRQAEQSFYADMAKAQAEFQPVVANRENAHTKSRYADIKQLHNTIKPIYTRYGFSASGRPKPSKDGFVGVILTIAHMNGHKKEIEGDFPLDVAGARGNANKTALQGMGSTFTYARRYLTLMAFDIPIDDDKDGNSQPDIAEPEKIEDSFNKAQTVQDLVRIMNSLKPAEKKAFKDKFDIRRAELSGASQ